MLCKCVICNCLREKVFSGMRRIRLSRNHAQQDTTGRDNHPSPGQDTTAGCWRRAYYRVHVCRHDYMSLICCDGLIVPSWFCVNIISFQVFILSVVLCIFLIGRFSFLCLHSPQEEFAFTRIDLHLWESQLAKVHKDRLALVGKPIS